MISVLTTAPSVQKEAELQVTGALVAINAPFRAVVNNDFKTLLTSSDFRGVNPVSWWKMGKRLEFPEQLVNVAMCLVNGIPNSAGLERCFSTSGMTSYAPKWTWRSVENLLFSTDK